MSIIVNMPKFKIIRKNSFLFKDIKISADSFQPHFKKNRPRFLCHTDIFRPWFRLFLPNFGCLSKLLDLPIAIIIIPLTSGLNCSRYFNFQFISISIQISIEFSSTIPSDSDFEFWWRFRSSSLLIDSLNWAIPRELWQPPLSTAHRKYHNDQTNGSIYARRS